MKGEESVESKGRIEGEERWGRGRLRYGVLRRIDAHPRPPDPRPEPHLARQHLEVAEERPFHRDIPWA